MIEAYGSGGVQASVQEVTFGVAKIYRSSYAKLYKVHANRQTSDYLNPTLESLPE